jgi:hypothetical protein
MIESVLWWASGLLLPVVLVVMIRALRAGAQTLAEWHAALLAYAAPIPGALIMAAAPFGLSPLLLAAPSIAYIEILVATRGKPIDLLGYVIDRIDKKMSDRLSGRLVVLILLTVLVGGLARLAL